MGASIYGGRWNSIGNFVLYTAQTSSLSILEHLVHVKGTNQNSKYKLSIIDIGNAEVAEIDGNAIDPLNFKQTQNVGNEWLSSKKSPILKVPSIINPTESDFIINPNHSKLKMHIISQEWFVYDSRLRL